ncbi:GGDEF domain-containing protein [Lacrimispora brassicae]
MTGNSGRRFEEWNTVNEHEFFRFSETEQMYRNMSLFKDTVLFEYYYMDGRLYLSPNARGQIDLRTFGRILVKHKDNPPKGGEIRSFEFCLGKRGEPYHWCSCRITAQWEAGTGSPLKLIGKLQDITGLKAREEQLLLQSLKDGLTGLYNKMAFEYRVEEKLKDGGWGWLCMIDIDNFKEINDCFGHLAGDRILMQVGGMLCDIYPEPDLVGRVGGDEFVVFTEEGNVRERAENLLNRVEEIIPEERGHLSISIGIVPSTGKQGEDYQKLFSRADRAMYQAKQSGKNRIAVFYED